LPNQVNALNRILGGEKAMMLQQVLQMLDKPFLFISSFVIGRHCIKTNLKVLLRLVFVVIHRARFTRDLQDILIRFECGDDLR